MRYILYIFIVIRVTYIKHFGEKDGEGIIQLLSCFLGCTSKISFVMHVQWF